MATQIAGSMLREWVGEERAAEATGRMSAALAASAAAARNPNDFYQCTPESIGQCIAIAALTEIMPGTGAASLAYVVPQRPRKNEPPQLQFMFSHRGLNALARRTGQTMIGVPISHSDTLEFDSAGDVRVVSRDIDNPPTEEKDLRGIMVIVRELTNGQTICKQWVPKKIIDQRRAVSRAGTSEYGPWTKWYVEMAMKTAMHYAISRGWCVIDDAAATRALSAEQTQDLRVAQQQQPSIEADARSASDRLADELGAPSDQVADPDDVGDEFDRQSQAGEQPQDEPAQGGGRRTRTDIAREIEGQIRGCETVEQVQWVLDDTIPNSDVTEKQSEKLTKQARERLDELNRAEPELSLAERFEQRLNDAQDVDERKAIEKEMVSAAQKNEISRDELDHLKRVASKVEVGT